MLLGLLLVDLQDHDDDDKALVAGNKVLQGMDKEELVFQAIAYGESARRSESKAGTLKHILPLQAVLDDMCGRRRNSIIAPQRLQIFIRHLMVTNGYNGSW